MPLHVVHADERRPQRPGHCLAERIPDADDIQAAVRQLQVMIGKIITNMEELSSEVHTVNKTLEEMTNFRSKDGPWFCAVARGLRNEEEDHFNEGMHDSLEDFNLVVVEGSFGMNIVVFVVGIVLVIICPTTVKRLLAGDIKDTDRGHLLINGGSLRRYHDDVLGRRGGNGGRWCFVVGYLVIGRKTDPAPMVGSLSPNKGTANLLPDGATHCSDR